MTSLNLWTPQRAVPGGRPPRARPLALRKRSDEFAALLRSFPLTYFWPCQETGGARLSDSVQNQQLATQGTATAFQQGGLLEAALLWDGVAQFGRFVDAGGNLQSSVLGPALSGADAVTVLTICRLSATPAAIAGILTGVIGAGTTGVGMFITAARQILFGSRSIATDGQLGPTSTYALAVGAWYLLAGVLDFKNKRIDIYVNGGLVTNVAAAFGSNTYVHSYVSGADLIGSSAADFPGDLSHLAVIKGRVNPGAHKELARIVGVTL